MPRGTGTPRDWPVIVAAAKAAALGYNTLVTLRQLHYRMVASGVGAYVNTDSCYQMLSKHTAERRRYGGFPALADLTRGVDRPNSYADPAEARDWLAQTYRRDRTEGQPVQTWVIFEKATLSAQVQAWTQELSLPTAALRGYSSESLESEVFDAMTNDGRPVVAYYLGDLDPEGEDIERNFVARATEYGISFKSWERLAVTPAQVAQLNLVPNPGKPASTRAAGFIAKYGALFQIEAEAVDPVVLEQLVTDAVRDPAIFDQGRWQESVDQEAQDRAELAG